MSFEFGVSMKNIGPHAAISFSDIFNTNKTLLYARNGAGKTFISRMFRLVEKGYEATKETADELLSVGEHNGEFQFTIKDSQAPELLKLKIKLDRHKIPYISNSTGYIFHVFNSDYVEENLQKLGYSPSGEIEGFVIGKENIDLSEEKTRLLEIENMGKILRKQIEDTVSAAQENLKALGVRSNQTEFKAITPDAIINDQFDAPNGDYERLCLQLSQLSAFSEDTPDILCPEISFNFSLGEELIRVLTVSHERANFSEEFLERVRRNPEFIKTGLAELDIKNGICPFCEQLLNDSAINLIHLYERYLADKEAEIIASIKKLRTGCNQFMQIYSNHLNQIYTTITTFDSMKSVFPGLGQTVLPELPSQKEIEDSIAAIIKMLDAKSKDITAVVSDAITSIAAINGILGKATLAYSDTKAGIDKFNRAKSDLSGEKKKLKAAICIEMSKVLHNDLRQNVLDYQGKRKEYVSLDTEIKTKEAGGKTPKRVLVATTFTKLLAEFFGSKYTFNIDEFHLVFQEMSLKGIASKVLSEGEKCIIAFCYYLASTTLVVEDADDYNQLFFVIDDPISSLDYHFVYCLAQILRSLEKHIGAGNLRHKRFLVLTHSSDFYNILSRNNIVSNRLLLTSNNITKSKKNHILVYHEHLRDVYQVARGFAVPGHTLGNSVRHILETLWRTERPDLDTYEEYFMSLDELAEDEYLYTLSQDLSHAPVGTDVPFDAALIRRGCESVIRTVEKRYIGQITVVADELGMDSIQTGEEA